LTPDNWPIAAYFNEGTSGAQQQLAELELVGRANWRELYRHKSNGSYWRLDVADKYQQRFLVRMDTSDGWETVDTSDVEKALLLAHRGGLGSAPCMQQGCSAAILLGSAFCLGHTYDRGMRK
jgi:hypothetical protein